MAENNPKPTNHNFKDLTGFRFARLNVIEYSHSNWRGHSYWKCICDCGNQKIIPSSHLKTGNTKSCGCFRKEVVTGNHVFTKEESDKGPRRAKEILALKPLSNRPKRIAAGFCADCEQSRDSASIRYCSSCLDSRIKGSRAYHRDLRERLLKLYGNKCKQCDHKDSRVLCIDHVNGHGITDRKRFHPTAFLKHVIQEVNSGTYQLLCANCNHIKRLEQGNGRFSKSRQFLL